MALSSSITNFEKDQVLFEESTGMRKVILNRPQKLNVINYEMIIQMLKKFGEYENDPTVKLVILKGNGEDFCVGGDVLAAVNVAIFGHWTFLGHFYRKQMTLDHLLATYSKPLVAFLNGAVMGGGAGISMHVPFRIVTEKTVFSMPEVLIGLFPDVGASHFLSRLPGFFGEYLGLTAAQLDGTEMLACGLATHFIHSEDLVPLESELTMLASSGSSSITMISKTIDKFAKRVDLKRGSAYARLDVVNKCFSRETVEEILSSLRSFATEADDMWIKVAIRAMRYASPLSLKISLRSIRKGRSQSLEQCLIREYIVLSHVGRRTVNSDFFEGARAMFIDKDFKPRWGTSKLELVSDGMVNKFFTNSFSEDDGWELLRLPTRSNLDYEMISRL